MAKTTSRLAARATLLLMTMAAALTSCGVATHGRFPPPLIPAQPGPGDWPDVGAAVLEDVATLTYRRARASDTAPLRIVAVLDHRRRLKVLSEAGLRFAEVRMDIDAFSTVTEVYAQAIAPNGTITTMPPNAVRAVARRNPRHQAPELKTLVFHVPGARVGGIIDIRTTRVYTAPELVDPWLFGGPMPVLRSEFSIVTDRDIKIDFRYGRGETLADVRPLRRELDDGRQRFVFVERDLAPFYSEPRMPHPTHIVPWVATVVTNARIGRNNLRLESWTDVAKRMRSMFVKVGGEAGKGSAEERYRTVRDKLNAVTAAGLGVREPIPGKGLSFGEPACSRDATAYLLKVLQDSGARAYPALLAAPSGPVALEGFPALYPFVRAVVAVDVRDEVARDPSCRRDPIKRGLLCSVPEESFAFLDPTCRNCRYGELPTELTGGRALVLIPGQPKWVDVAADPPERNRMMVQYRYQLDVNGHLTGALSGDATGAPARAIRRGLEDLGDQFDKRTALLASHLLADKSETKLADVAFGARKSADKPLRVMAKVTATAEKLAYQRFRIAPAELVGPAMPGRWRRSRRTPAMLEAPAWRETVASIDLPVGYRANVGEVVKIVEPFAEYAAGYAQRGRTLSYSRRLVLKQRVIAPAQWPAMRAFLDRIADLEAGGIDVFLVE